jgi:signal transduction histidine kinase
MDQKKRSPSSERDQTDQSLRGERENADRALAEKREQEAGADRLVQGKRDRADAALSVARDKADVELASGVPGASQPRIDQERALEDATVRRDRAASDEALRLERESSARALAELLPLEREKTDRFLLTERTRSDDALSSRDDFLGIVSHDLRNLLGGIVLSAEVLSRKAGAGDEASRIQRYAARMNRLIGDLLDVASIEAGKLSVTPVMGDFSALVREAVDLFRAAASARGVGLHVEAEAPAMFEFDHDRMLQVLANLVTNAVKFTPDGGTITLRCDVSDAGLHFSITDTGRGIPQDLLEQVFERFWQVGTNDRQGLGLGLYISRCIVEAHGGTIRAQSDTGRGATLTFTLPPRLSPA